MAQKAKNIIPKEKKEQLPAAYDTFKVYEGQFMQFLGGIRII